MTFGRAARADWQLEDPTKTLSSVHFEVFNRGTEIFVTDLSLNGTFINGTDERLVKGQDRAIHPGDELRLGDYAVVFAEIEADRPALAQSAVEPSSSSFDLDTSEPPSDLDELLNGASRRSGRSAIDDVLSEPQAMPGQVLPDIDHVGRGAGEIDDAFSTPLLSEPAQAGPGAAQIPDSWDFSDMGVTGPAPTAPDAPPLISQTINQRKPTEPELGAPTSQPDQVSPAPDGSGAPTMSATTGDAFVAFLTGAGLNPADFKDQDPAAVMRTAGEVYRQAILNYADILRDRSYLKNEFRLDRTIVGLAENNPLKFFPAPEAAVRLLCPPQTGFLDAPTSIREAGQDIKKHQIAVLSGLRAALGALVERFRPDTILQAIEAGSGKGFLGGGNQSNRMKAAWARFTELHANCEDEASHNADSFLNRAFRKGYEEQVDAMESSK